MSRRPQSERSPPLHHPVPQHISSVPQLRSPPPPTSSQPQSQNYGNPYQQQGAVPGSTMFGQAAGQFLSDPTTQVATRLGASAFKQGQAYVQQNLIKTSILKHYFQVDLQTVLRKLGLILYPFSHKSFTRNRTKTTSDGTVLLSQPRDDINSPDLYVPVMALPTYMYLVVIVLGLRGQFAPDLLSYTLSGAVVTVAVDALLLWLGCYLCGFSDNTSVVELLAYSSYKFVSLTFSIIFQGLLGYFTGGSGTVRWLLFLYFYFAYGYFTFHSLRSNLQGGNAAGSIVATRTPTQHRRRGWLSLIYSFLLQLVIFLLLSRA